MPEKTDLNVSPYYDDYSEDKNFHKIIYRASRPLQSRELTQSQSILQNQIERFGDHIFKEGSIVSGAVADIDMAHYFVKVSSANPNAGGDANVETYRTASHGNYVKGKLSGVVAKIITSSAETSDDKLTLFVKYLSQGTDTNHSYAFTASEELETVTLSSSGGTTAVAGDDNDFKVVTTADTPNGRSSIANISEGIIYTRGFFVKVPTQELILEKYSGAPTYKVGLTITESFVTSAIDDSLQDNSTGTTNENAVGADRLKVALTLSKTNLLAVEDTNFIELIRVNKGIIELQVNRPMYSEIENTLARRTFDANGDFVVRQFSQSMREHLDDTTNRGYYTKALGGLEEKFIMQISPGKAYVKGYEIDKVGTTPLPISKARTTKSIVGANTPIRLGNHLRVKNAHSLPEFGNETTATGEPFGAVKLWDTTTTAGAEPSGELIGFGRVRDITLQSAVDPTKVFADTAVWELSMFDIKMFTRLTGTKGGTLNVGDQIVGSTSGATGIVAHSDGADIYVHDVQGTFVLEACTSNGTGAGTIGTLSAVRTYNVGRVRSVTQASEGSGHARFTADVVVDAVRKLSGDCSIAAAALTGTATRFTKELQEGDILLDSAFAEKIILSVTDDTTATLTTSGAATTHAKLTRKRVKLYNQDKTSAIFAWPRDWVKSHTPDDLVVRRQEVIEITGTNISTTLGSGETFESRTNDNFTIAVVAQASGSPTLLVGDVLDLTDYTIGVTGTPQSFTLSGFNSADNGAKLKITYTVKIGTPVNRDKTRRASRLLKVGSARASGNIHYGTCYDDKEISLGVPHVHKIRGIYESTDGTPLPPSGALTVVEGTTVSDEIIVGQSSSARARVIRYTGGGTTYFYYTNDNVFTNGETVVGQTSSASSTIASVSAGSQNITSRYFFDDGQRDGFYDLSKITRKTGNPAPNNSILVVFDSFTSAGGGDFFDVNSYSNIEYKDIPTYSPRRVDLGGLEPDGTFELSDCLDFRPVVGQILKLSTFSTELPNPTSVTDLSATGVNGARYAPFGYDTGRSFEASRTNVASTNANTVDTPSNDSNVVGEIEFYVSRIDKVFLHRNGSFIISTGNPALTPTKPAGIGDAIELYELYIPAYTKKLSNIRVRSQDHRRYTMRDIGKLSNRLINLERITSLSLLEKDTQTKQILDGEGFDRFKSGFLVDNFRGHRVGDVHHPDYNISIDGRMGAMRPKAFQQFFDITLNTATSSNYTKTGDLITLPYISSSYVNQEKASRSVNVNPYHVFAFTGNIKLTPETDVWQDTTQLPEVRINREGNYDAILASNNNALGTIWNEWQTSWVGEPVVVNSEVTATTSGSWSGDPSQGGQWIAGEQVTREMTETPESQIRSGIQTSVVEDFVETRSDRVVSVTLIPFMRARTIELDATNLKPDTNHYFFFDGIRVDAYVRPYDTNYSVDGGVTVASHVMADGNGRLRAYFDLPNSSAQRFPTGMREMFITSSFWNLGSPASSGSGVYQAQGLLQANQTEIVSTRNGKVIIEQLTGERQFSKEGEVENTEAIDVEAPEIPEDSIPAPEIEAPVSSPVTPPPQNDLVVEEAIVEERTWPDDREPRVERRPRRGRGWRDPLAQSIMCEASGGMFLTSVDLYFKTKAASIPVSVEIRNMVNGYPGQVVLPFSEVVKNPADVNTSTDGSSATTFTFPSPVYIQENQEFCFVVISNSNEFEAFISRMGENDLTSGQVISGQPYAGSLFMSQNASTWTAEQTDDLKFNLKIASFDVTKTVDLRFDNDALPVTTLQENPIETFSGSDYVKVYNYNHGMYSDTSNVTVAGVTADKTGAAFTITAGTPSTTPVAGTFSNVAQSATDEAGSGATFDITTAGSPVVITSIKLATCGSGYIVGEEITLTDFDGGTSDLVVTVNTVGDTLGAFPIDAINGTFEEMDNVELDSFTIKPDVEVAAYEFKTGYVADSSTLGGGAVVTSTRDYYYDTLHTIIPSLKFKNTSIYSSVYQTPMYSPEGYIDGTVYTKNIGSEVITLNDNVYFSSPSIVASPLNEEQEMESGKSFTAQIQLQSDNSNLSPIIDVGTLGVLAIANRLNNIDSATGKKLDATTNSLGTGTTYIASTEPDGDNNAMVYVTRKVNLKTSATAIRVAVDLFRPPTTDIKLMYKVLGNDDSTPFDDIGFQYFNHTGVSDGGTGSNAFGVGGDGTAGHMEHDAKNFKEYEYTAENLPEFGAFCVKIVGQGTNTSVVPLVSALRCIALAT